MANVQGVPAQFVQGLPTEKSDDGDFARQLLTILGPAYQGADGTNNAADMLALGGQLADVRAVLSDALAEAFVGEAWDLLSELEANYGLPVRPDLSVATRQSRLLAKVRAARAGTPQGIKTAIYTYDQTATFSENTPATVPRDTDVGSVAGGYRGVFQFVVVVKANAWNDAVIKATITAVLEQMKPAHTNYSVVTNAAFRVDDTGSLTDRDALGT